MHLVGIVGKYNQRHITQGAKRSNLCGIFGLSCGLGSHCCKELWSAEDRAKLRPDFFRD